MCICNGGDVDFQNPSRAKVCVCSSEQLQTADILELHTYTVSCDNSKYGVDKLERDKRTNTVTYMSLTMSSSSSIGAGLSSGLSLTDAR